MVQEQKQYIIAPMVKLLLLVFLVSFSPLHLKAQKGKLVRDYEALLIVDANDSSKLLDAIDVMPNTGAGSYVRFGDTLYIVDFAPLYGTDDGMFKDTTPINLRKINISKNKFNHLEKLTVQEPNRKIFKAVNLRVDSFGYTLKYKDWDKNLILEQRFSHKEMMRFEEIYANFRKKVLLIME
jgi:hypothetical protein